MYSLDVCVSYFTYLAIFTAHNGSREALNFPIDYLIDYVIITTNNCRKVIATRYLIINVLTIFVV